MEALKYVAGYVASKFRMEFPKLGSVTGKDSSQSMASSTWITCLSRGGLRQPSEEWFGAVQIMEAEFQRHHGAEDIRKEPGVIKTLDNYLKTQLTAVPEPAVMCFVKQELLYA